MKLLEKSIELYESIFFLSTFVLAKSQFKVVLVGFKGRIFEESMTVSL